MEEVRKEIPRLPKGKYFVSNLGRVKNGNVKNRKGKILKFEHNHYGHNRIKLYGAGGRNDVRHYQVHRLVYCVFNDLDYNFGLDKHISRCEGLILHKDNNPDNNRLDNLYIGTQKDNMGQCTTEGRLDISGFMTGQYHKKLTEKEVKDIIYKSNQGISGKALAEEYGVSKDAIYNIINGKTRKHVSRETSDEFGGTPTGTIPSQASQGGDEGVTTNSIPLDQGGSGHERPTSSES